MKLSEVNAGNLQMCRYARDHEGRLYKILGYMPEPSVIVECEDGRLVALGVSGLTARSMEVVSDDDAL